MLLVFKVDRILVKQLRPFMRPELPRDPGCIRLISSPSAPLDLTCLLHFNGALVDDLHVNNGFSGFDSNGKECRSFNQQVVL